MRGNGGAIFSSFAMSRSSAASSRARFFTTDWTIALTSPSPSSIMSSRCAYDASGSSIQNSVRCRRVFDFSARNVGPKRIHLAQRRGRRFHIKLPRLRQVGLLVVDVIHFEKRGRAFAGGGSKNGRVRQDVALVVHVIARRANGFRANAQNRRLPRRANPQMPLVEQKIDAVLFQLNRIRIGFRHALDNFDRR